MTVSESEITDVTITGDGETPTLGGVAVDTLDEAILEAQTPNVDGVSGATGDGIVMAQAVGADLVDIEQIRLHPTVEQTTSMLITEGVHGGNRIGGNAVADIVVFSRIAGANAIAYCGK